MQSSSVIRRTRKEKIKALLGTIAIKIAKEKGDPLYDRYQRARQLYLKYKEAIIKKYKNRAARLAKAAVASKSS